jgi:hypothetical protein
MALGLVVVEWKARFRVQRWMDGQIGKKEESSPVCRWSKAGAFSVGEKRANNRNIAPLPKRRR